MAKPPPRTAAGGKISIETQGLEEFVAYTDELGRESDRGAVLVAATRIDELLRRAIAGRLLDHPDTADLLDGFNAPLGTFAARTLAAFALGIISETEYRTCILIRRIRNEFAHKLGVTFEDRKIIDLVGNLRMGVKSFPGESTPNRRREFTSAAVTLASILNRRAEWVSDERLTHRNWGFTGVTR